MPAPIKSETTGALWNVQPLTAAQGRAYQRKGAPAPRWQATAPAGSIIRRADLADLTAAVHASTAR